MDQDGEFFWFPIIAGALIFGGWNVGIHSQQGDIHNFWDGLGYFVQGAVAGAAAGAGWSFGIAGIASSSTLAQIGGWTLIGGKAINAITTTASFINNPDNSLKIMMGKAYTDENRSFLGGLWQGISRFTWEGLQTWSGYNYTQIRNTVGRVDRVDYLGGATFATNENAGYRDGISLGNYVNINISDGITGDFEQRVISDPLFMHEYGHTFDSQIFGPAYLFAVGIPSANSASKASQVPGEPAGVSTHDFFWTEMRANRHAERYFSKHYNVNWLTLYRSGTIETYYPRRRR